MALWINQSKSEESSIPPVLRVKTEEYLLTRDGKVDRKVERTAGSGPPPPPPKRSDIIAAYTHGGGG